MNLSFLETSYLWALPLVAAPLVLHLLSNRAPRKVRFSDPRYIVRALERMHAGFRLKKYLILLLRTLALLLIVAYFARPVYQPAASGMIAHKEPAPVIFIIDVSYSMGAVNEGVSRFNACRQLAKASISALPEGTRAGVIAVSNRVESATPGLTNDRAALSAFLDTLTLSCRPTDFAPAWQSLRAMLAGYQGPMPAVALLTDGAKHSVAGKLPADAIKTRIILPQFPALANRWLLPPECAYNEDLAQWSCTANAAGASDGAGPVSFSLQADGRKVAADIARAGGAGLSAHMGWSTKNANCAGHLSLSADALSADNEYWFFARRAPDYQTWLIDGDPRLGGMGSKTLYVRKIFPRAEVLREDDAAQHEFSVPGTIICADVREYAPTIEGFVRNGGGCIVFPGGRFEGGSEPPWFPADIGNQFDTPATLAWQAQSHPIAAAIAVKDYDWDHVRIDKGYALQPRANATVLAVLSNGLPGLVEQSFGAGKVLLFCSTADREWGNLVARPVFVPLMRAAARYCASADETHAPPDMIVGDIFRWKPVDDPLIVRPDNTTARPSVVGRQLVYAALDLPGIYTLRSRGREAVSWAVNLDRSTNEGNLENASLSLLREYFGGMPLTACNADQWSRTFQLMLSGTDISRQALLLALLLLLAELWLTSGNRRRP